MDFWIVFSSFLIGTVGALFVVWLRWIGTLPTFSSSIEIQGCEEEYKKITSFISKKLEDQKEITESEEKYSNDLRDDLWRQRTKSFLTSAILYTILGGATAVLFVGLELQSITDSANIAKLLAAGALWTTFYSFIDVKKTSAAIDSKKESLDEINLAIVSNLQKQLENEKNKVIEYANKFNHVVEAYNELAKGNGGK
jgi:hypothetical protein